VARFLEAAPGPKWKAALSAANAAGLRVSGVVALKANDVDSQRMLLRIEPHSPPRLWLSRTAVGAAARSNTLIKSRNQQHLDPDPFPNTRAVDPHSACGTVGAHLSRDLPWRLSDPGPGVCRTLRHGPASETLHKSSHRGSWWRTAVEPSGPAEPAAARER
jgi:hypothetical protein